MRMHACTAGPGIREAPLYRRVRRDPDLVVRGRSRTVTIAPVRYGQFGEWNTPWTTPSRFWWSATGTSRG